LRTWPPTPRERPDGGDHRHLAADQIGRQHRQLIVLAVRPAELDRQIVALDIAGFTQPLAHRAHPVCEPFGRASAEYAHHRWLLRAHRERPPDRRAAERR
jgi:hypothetical protein